MACDSTIETTEDAQTAALSKDPKVLLENSKEKQRIGAYDEAIEILNMAVKIDPKFVPAYNQIGLILFEADKKKESVEAFKNATQLGNRYAWRELFDLMDKIAVKARAFLSPQSDLVQK